MAQTEVNKLTWRGIERTLQDLEFTLPCKFKRMVCISRGGLALGGMLGYMLDIREIAVLSVLEYEGQQQQQLLRVHAFPPVERFNDRDTLFVDDITDTG